jgi:hypothetical protein
VDAAHFDALTRTLHARRTALTGVLGGVVALLGRPGIDEARAHNPLPHCQKIKDPAARRQCVRNARRHNKQKHACTPEPTATFCCNRCGPTQNNCEQTVTCTCPAGKGCLANNGCNQTCSPAQPTCVEGCTCGVPLVEDPAIFHCVPSLILSAGGIECTDFLQCETTADCPRGYFCGDQTVSCGMDLCFPNCPV